MKLLHLSLLLLLLLPFAGHAQFTCTTNDGAVTITGYTGSGGSIVIPHNFNGYPVTGIGLVSGHDAITGDKLTTELNSTRQP